jgi:hypothetical protein
VLLGLTVLAAPFSGQLRGLGRRAVRPLLGAVGLYVALLGVSILASFDPARSARGLSEIFSLCTLLLGLVLLRDERTVRAVLDAVVLLAAFEALVGLVQLVAAGGPDLDHRIQGTMSHYMTFSGVLMIADLVLLGRLLAGGRAGGWRTDWRIWALLPINAALIATLTRSAWVGLAAGGRRLAAARPPAAAAVVGPGGAARAATAALVGAGARGHHRRPHTTSPTPTASAWRRPAGR